MLTVAIENSYNHKFSWKDTFWAMFFMQKYFSEKWINLIRVSVNRFNKKTWYFEEYGKMDDNKEHVVFKKKIKPDIIWVRKSSYAWYKYEVLKNFKMVPWLKIATIWNDKMENFKFLSKYQPMTCLLSSFFNSTYMQNQLDKKLVLKPIRANWWKWIKLLSKKELFENKDKYEGLEELFIVQSFKDFSKWFWDISKWWHDIRLMFAWNKIIETTLREPKKWDFRSNIWSWWTQRFIDNNKIPKELLRLAKKIYKDLEISDDNIFSMDFAYCKKEEKWYLLEINSSPWTRFYQTDKEILKKIFKWFTNFFINLDKQC